MHMADALISPAVGTTMWLATAGLIAYSSKQVKKEADDRKIPLMGVLGAFIFAAQMINFSIPGTGSSGHLGGGMLLAVLLGPFSAFLVMASVLIVQALFFGDGGLLALGCNIFNLGFFPCFIAYIFIYRKIVGCKPSKGKIVAGSLLAAIIGLQLGSFGVVLETVFSGISELPFNTFVIVMQPIHLAIGIVEGMVTAATIMFVYNARPEIINAVSNFKPIGQIKLKKVFIGFLLATLIIGGGLSWFASSNPDGLEWAMFKTSGKEELESHYRVHAALSDFQEKTAFMPDYGFKQTGLEAQTETELQQSWPAVDPGTSLAGLVGGGLIFLLIILMGLGLRQDEVAA